MTPDSSKPGDASNKARRRLGSNPQSSVGRSESTLREMRVDDSSDMTREQRAVVIPPEPSSTAPRRFSVASPQLFRPWSIAAALIAVVVAFVAVGVWRSDNNFEAQLNTESEGDLTRILASLSSESRSLQEELASVKVALANAQNSTDRSDSQSAEAKARLNSLRVLAGTVPVNGPGLVITIKDPNFAVTYDQLVDAVEELRDAGAEAIAVNGRRVGVSSSFGQNGRDVTLDGVGLPTPYVINVIGPASTLEGGLQIPGGTLDTLRSISGVSVEVQRNNALNLPALDAPPSFKQATPIAEK